MTTRDSSVTVKDFLGVNRRDGGDKVLNNQFYKIQNMYPLSKGIFYKRQGTTENLDVADVPGVDKIIGIHRHYDSIGRRYTLHLCKSKSTDYPSDTVTAPTVAEINDGDLFNGGAVVQLKFYYQWVGMGRAWHCSAQSTITVSANTKGVRITVPAFPSGIKSAEVYVEYAGSASTFFVGQIFTSAGSFDFLHYIGPIAAGNDRVGVPKTSNASQTFPSGSLPRGTYYISCCVLSKDGTGYMQVNEDAPGGTNPYLIVRIEQDGGASIPVYNLLAGAATTNGATYAAWFIGLKPPLEGPMTYVGVSRISPDDNPTGNEVLSITDIPKNTRMHAVPVSTTGNVSNGKSAFNIYNNTFAAVNAASANSVSALTTAIISLIKQSDGTLYEAFFTNPSGSNAWYSADYDRWYGWVIDPDEDVPVFTSHLGLIYVAVNGKHKPIQIDGHSITEQVVKSGTASPGRVNYVSSFKNQLICTVPGYKNQIFGSNALQPNNWASGGTGTSLRFVTVGDPFGDGVRVVDIFSYTSGTEGPKALLFAGKKASTWVVSQIPDLTSGVPASMDQLSGRVGCTARRSICQTPIGLVFLGSDGDVYLSRGSGEPYKIGGSVRPILEHLSKDEDLMDKVTACYHEGFYKLSYPSSTTSTANDAQLWADLRTEQGIPIVWTGPHLGFGLGQQLVLVGEGDNNERLGLLANGSMVVNLDQQSTFQDLGVAIDSVLETKTYRLGSDFNYKKLTGIALDAYYDSAYSHTVLHEAFMDDQYASYEQELSDGAGVWDSSAFDSTGQWGDAMFQPVVWQVGPTPLVGRTLKYKMTHSDNAQFIVAAIGATFQTERRRISP